MKRLAAVLAATVLASGCGFHDDDCTGTVTVEWVDFLTASGSVTPSCGAAGVDFIDIFIDGQAVDQRFFCSDGGATIVGLRRGTHLFTVEGVQANLPEDFGLIVNRHEFQIDARCGDAVVRVQPAAGFANLNYEALGGCSTDTDPGSGTCKLWFQLFDVTANAVDPASITRTSTPASVLDTYTYPGDVLIALPVGPYTLDWMELVSKPLSYFPEATKCSPTSFTVTGGTTVLPSVPLADGGPACH